MKEYWPNTEIDGRFAIEGLVMSLPGRIALILIEKWGTVAGHIREKEDSSGRAVLDVMPVEDVVKRAFDMAELATVELERRKWIRAVNMTPEQLGAQLRRVEDARYKPIFRDEGTGTGNKGTATGTE